MGRSDVRRPPDDKPVGLERAQSISATAASLCNGKTCEITIDRRRRRHRLPDTAVSGQGIARQHVRRRSIDHYAHAKAGSVRSSSMNTDARARTPVSERGPRPFPQRRTTRSRSAIISSPGARGTRMTHARRARHTGVRLPTISHVIAPLHTYTSFVVA